MLFLARIDQVYYLKTVRAVNKSSAYKLQLLKFDLLVPECVGFLLLGFIMILMI